MSIVSGGAKGIDAAAHNAALEVGGHTVVCLPAGIANGGMARQRALCSHVLHGGGAILSCEKPDSKHQRGGYRRRNRVIVGMIDALIVVCGAPSSGTMITAEMASRAGLPRFAVPWTIGTPNSGGSNELLADDWLALPEISDPARVLKRLLAKTDIDVAGRGWQRYAPTTPAGPQPMRVQAGMDKALVAALDRALAQQQATGLSLEEMVAATGVQRAELAPLVLRLQLTGQLRQAAFGRYVRC